MKSIVLLGAFLALTLAQSADVLDLLPQPLEVNDDQPQFLDTIDTVSPEASSEESYLEEDSPESVALSEDENLLSEGGEPALIAVGEITAPEAPQPVNEEEPSDKSGNAIADASIAALNTVLSEPTLEEKAIPVEAALAKDLNSENSISETESEESSSESESGSDESLESEPAEIQSEPGTSVLTATPTLSPTTTAPISAPTSLRTQAQTTIIPSTLAPLPSRPPIPILLQSFSSTAAPTKAPVVDTITLTSAPELPSTAAPTLVPSSSLPSLAPSTQAPFLFTFAPSSQATPRAPSLFRPLSPTISPFSNFQSRFNQIASKAPAQQPTLLKVTPSASPNAPGPTVSVQILSSPEQPAEAPVVLLRKPTYNTYQSGKDRAAKTLRYDNYINPDNSYRYLYETDNGIYAQADGYLRDFGDGQFGNIVTGGFSWINPDGYETAIRYVADENGYHPEGDAIPTAPPIPPLIVKSLRYLKQFYPEIEI